MGYDVNVTGDRIGGIPIMGGDREGDGKGSGAYFSDATPGYPADGSVIWYRILIIRLKVEIKKQPTTHHWVYNRAHFAFVTLTP